MNKKDLVNKVAGELNITKKDAGLAVTATIDSIAAGLAEDKKVTLVGFGTFSLAARAARTARNPQNGEPVEVPAKTVPKFKPSKILKEAVVDIDMG